MNSVIARLRKQHRYAPDAWAEQPPSDIGEILGYVEALEALVASVVMEPNYFGVEAPAEGPDQEVQVWHRCPVAVHVDTASGKVTRVVVIDDEVALDPVAGVTFSDYSGPAPQNVAAKALEVIDAGGEWPAWDWGY